MNLLQKLFETKEQRKKRETFERDKEIYVQRVVEKWEEIQYLIRSQYPLEEFYLYIMPLLPIYSKNVIRMKEGEPLPGEKHSYPLISLIRNSEKFDWEYLVKQEKKLLPEFERIKQETESPPKKSFLGKISSDPSKNRNMIRTKEEEALPRVEIIDRERSYPRKKK